MLERDSERVIRAAVESGEGIDARRTDHEEVGVHQLAVRERHRAARLLERESTGDREEIGDPKGEVAGSARQIALRAVGGERKGLARAGANGEVGRFVVDDEVSGVMAGERVVETVHLDRKRVARDRETRDADHGEIGGARLESCPRNVFVVDLAFEQREREVHAGETETHCVTRIGWAVHAHEGIHASATNGQKLRQDLVAVGERHGLFGLLKGEAAGELHETKEIEIHVAGGAHDFAVIRRQRDFAFGVRAGGDRQRHRFIIDERVVGRVIVDGNGDRVGFDGEAFNADERGATGFGLKGAPAALGVGLVGLDDPREAYVAEFKAERRFTVLVGQADERIHAVGTHGEAFHFDGRAVAQFRFAVALAEGEVAGELHKTVEVHFHAAAGTEERAIIGIEFEGEGVRAARGHPERRRREIDHVRVIVRIDFDLAVDFDRQRLHGQRHTRDADKRGGLGARDQGFPFPRHEELGVFVAQFFVKIRIREIDAGQR